YDRVLLDTGAGISEVVLYSVSLADKVLVVATPEPTSLTDAYATIKVLAGQQHRRLIKLVVNQVGRLGEGRVIRGQLQLVIDRFVTPQTSGDGNAIRLELMGEIPTDSAVRDSVQKRQLLMEMLPGCPAANAVRLLGEKIAQ
ncbi:MAG: MinD/ParA family protein, partial [Burkholderiales bacterium]